MSVSIRAFEDGDRVRWGELWQAYLTFYEAELPGEVTDNTWKNLMASGAGHEGIAAFDADGHMIGFTHYLIHRSTWTTGSYCYLEDLFVDPTCRGLGAGRALIDGVEASARDAGSVRLYLVTQEFNGTARGLYDKTMTRAPFVQYRKLLDD